MSVTHVAGPPVVFNCRVIQRCVVCGEKLLDSLRCMAPLNPDGSQPSFPTYPERHYIHVDGNQTTVGVDYLTLNVDEPVDFCIDLVEEP